MIVDEVKPMSDEIKENIKSQKKDDKIKSKKRRKRTTDFADRPQFDQMRFDRMMRIFRKKVKQMILMKTSSTSQTSKVV
jgi:hypothetical protein